MSNWPLGSTFFPIAHWVCPSLSFRAYGLPPSPGTTAWHRVWPLLPGGQSSLNYPRSAVPDFLDDLTAQGALDQVQPGERGGGRVVVWFVGVLRLRRCSRSPAVIAARASPLGRGPRA